MELIQNYSKKKIIIVLLLILSISLGLKLYTIDFTITSHLDDARILSLTISTITIFPMYVLARKFFNEKYSIVAVSLFAFEPHLNFISGTAMEEPLLILVLITSMILILNDKAKYHYIAFIWIQRIYDISKIF